MFVRLLRLIACIGIAVGCLYLCFGFARLLETNARTRDSSNGDQLNQQLILLLDEVFSQKWTLDSSGWEWGIEPSIEQADLPNVEPRQPIAELFSFATLDLSISSLDSLVPVSATHSQMLETQFSIGNATISIRSRKGTGNQSFDECSICCPGDADGYGNAAGKTLVFRRKPESPQEPILLLPIPKSFESIMSQRANGGALVTNLIVRREGTEKLLDFWTNRGYSISSITRAELPPDTYLVMTNDSSFLVWHPIRSNPQGIALMREIPGKLGNLISSTSIEQPD